jgi:hypothetical protein
MTATTKITVLADVILKGWQCPQAKLWRVPLVDNVRNENTDTLLLDHPHKHDCLNLLYKVASTTTIQEHINTIMLQTIGWEYIHNMYKLASISANNQIPTCGGRIPGGKDMAQSNPMGQLQLMAPDQHH